MSNKMKKIVFNAGILLLLAVYLAYFSFAYENNEVILDPIAGLDTQIAVLNDGNPSVNPVELVINPSLSTNLTLNVGNQETLSEGLNISNQSSKFYVNNRTLSVNASAGLNEEIIQDSQDAKGVNKLVIEPSNANESTARESLTKSIEMLEEKDSETGQLKAGNGPAELPAVHLKESQSIVNRIKSFIWGIFG